MNNAVRASRVPVEIIMSVGTRGAERRFSNCPTMSVSLGTSSCAERQQAFPAAAEPGRWPVGRLEIRSTAEIICHSGTMKPGSSRAFFQRERQMSGRDTLLAWITPPIVIPALIVSGRCRLARAIAVNGSYRLGEGHRRFRSHFSLPASIIHCRQEIHDTGTSTLVRGSTRRSNMLLVSLVGG